MNEQQNHHPKTDSSIGHLGLTNFTQDFAVVNLKTKTKLLRSHGCFLTYSIHHHGETIN